MPTMTKSTKKDLQRAADLLQRAHDWIEVHGFDISDYGTHTQSEVARAIEEAGDDADCLKYPMCYIGTLRFLADPDLDPAPQSEDPADDDGPELAIALAKLDEIAKSRMSRIPQSTWAAAMDGPYAPFLSNVKEGQVLTGKFIEALGFLIRYRADERCDDMAEREVYQKNYALRILRKALSEIYS